MATLGTLLNITIALYAGYFGYAGILNPGYLLLCAVGFMVGHVLRRTHKRSSIWETRHRNILVALVYNFLFSALLVVIFFGVGFGIQFLLEFKPAEGVGRY